MKNFIHQIIKVAAFCLLISAFLFSCKKIVAVATSSTGLLTVVTAQSISFDGAAGFAFNSNIGTMQKAGNTLNITAIQDGKSNFITIIIIKLTGTGTYNFDSGNQISVAGIGKDYNKSSDTNLSYSTDNSGGGGLTGRGSVTITKLTATDAEGTFEITGYNASGKTASATHGTFKGHVN